MSDTNSGKVNKGSRRQRSRRRKSNTLDTAPVENTDATDSKHSKGHKNETEKIGIMKHKEDKLINKNQQRKCNNSKTKKNSNVESDIPKSLNKKSSVTKEPKENKLHRDGGKPNKNKSTRNNVNNKEFTFKNTNERKKQVRCEIGIQTEDPIKIAIDSIFSQNKDKIQKQIDYSKDVEQQCGKQHHNSRRNSDQKISEILSNANLNLRRGSLDIGESKSRKWSNATTLVGDPHMIGNVRSQGQVGVDEFAFPKLDDEYLYKDPYLLKESLTIEDLNSTNVLKKERDMNRLKNAIETLNIFSETEDEEDTDKELFYLSTIDEGGDIRSISEGEESTKNKYETSPTEFFILNNEVRMDMWLDYPSCCYNSLLQD